MISFGSTNESGLEIAKRIERHNQFLSHQICQSFAQRMEVLKATMEPGTTYECLVAIAEGQKTPWEEEKMAELGITGSIGFNIKKLFEKKSSSSAAGSNDKPSTIGCNTTDASETKNTSETTTTDTMNDAVINQSRMAASVFASACLPLSRGLDGQSLTEDCLGSFYDRLAEYILAAPL